MLAIDLGGTKIATGLVSASGSLTFADVRPTLADEGPQKVLDRLVSAARDALKKANTPKSGIRAVGVAVAGVIDTRRGLVTASPNLPGWRNVPLQSIVQDALGIRAYLIHDASAAALAEHRLGAGRGVSDLVYVTVGTGIGGGIILEGRLYLGADGCAGEVGHMTIDSSGPQCFCGNIGCLEVMASGSAIAREAVRRLERKEKSSLTSLSGADHGKITARLVGQAARRGDALAMGVVSRSANYLGIGLVNLVNIFNPERIVIGGGVVKLGGLLLGPACRLVKERAFSLPAQTVRILRAELVQPSLIGAALYVFQLEEQEAKS